jgi:predicted O-methyltransferase YrrM
METAPEAKSGCRHLGPLGIMARAKADRPTDGAATLSMKDHRPMPADPFAVKRYARRHPRRLAHKSLALSREWHARRRFDHYALPQVLLPDVPPVPEADWSATSVTPIQMQHLLHALRLTESQTGTVIVEVGCYRGETTKCLARATGRTVVAVDPYIGYGGAEAEFARFRENLAGLPNVVHERTTSGAASRAWRYGPASLIFIDAVHDYANTAFDIEAWSTHLAPGGILALHDTDQLCFAGTRRAAFEALGRSTLLAHPENLTLLIVH